MLNKEVGDKEAERMAYWNLGIAYSSLYDFPETIEVYQRNVNIAKEIGNKKSEAMGYIKLGCLDNSRGDFRKVIEFNQQGLVIAKEIGDNVLEGKAYMVSQTQSSSIRRMAISQTRLEIEN